MSTILPRAMWLDLTNVCNNQCSWCYAQDSLGEDARRSELDIEVLKKRLPTIREVGVTKVILIGGGPTLYRDCESLIALLAEQGFDVSIVSNGRAFARGSVIESIIKNNVRVTISFHGYSEESYFKQTKSRTGFREALAGYKHLKDLNISPSPNIVLSRHTKDFPQGIVGFISETLGSKSVGFNVATPAVSPGNVNRAFVLEFSECADHVMDVFRRCQDRGIRTTFQLGIPFCAFTSSNINELLEAGAVQQGCHVLRGGGIVYRYNNALAICSHLSSFEISSSGTIDDILNSKRSFETFWKSEELESIRKKANHYRYDKCEECAHWVQCGGGCFIQFATLERTITTKEPIYGRAEWVYGKAICY